MPSYRFTIKHWYCNRYNNRFRLAVLDLEGLVMNGNTSKNLYKYFAKIVHQNIWLLLLPILSIHLLVLGEYINRHKSIMQMNQEARQAMERLIIRAGQFMKPADFKIMLEELDSTGINLGDYKLTFSLMESSSANLQKSNPFDNWHVDNSTANFYYLLQNGKWLHYTESPASSSFDLPLWIVLFEMLIIGLIVFYFWSGSRFTVPLKNFKLSAERFGDGLNTEFFSEYGPSVVREAADAMNKMQRRIQDLINSRTQLLAAISHDLRTPITRLKLRAQFLHDSEQSEKVIQDLDEMEVMITEILIFARNDVALEKKIKFDINALLLSVCYGFIDRGYSINMTLNQGNISFFGRSIALKRTFTNLIENAIKHAGHAHVTLIQIDDKIIITVEDNGPGIPEEELEKVLLPYYRSVNTGSQNNIGTGLGLTIADDVVKSHNGVLVLKNRDQQGLQAAIILPLHQELVCH